MMFDQYKTSRIWSAYWLRPHAWADSCGVGCFGVLIIDTVCNNFPIGDTAYFSLIESRTGLLIKMHAAVPEAIGPDGIEAILGLPVITGSPVA